MKKAKVLAVAASAQSAAALAAGAKALGDSTCLVYLGSDLEKAQADKAFALAADKLSVSAVMPQLISIIEREQPDLVLTDASRNGRYAAAYAAAAMQVAPITDAVSVKLDGDAVTATRLVYGGKAIKTENAKSKAVITVTATTFEADDTIACNPCVQEEGSVDERVHMTAFKEKEVQTVNISAAKSVIGVGRGIKEEENLRYVEELAKLTGAEIACTRPVSEEMKWYPRERYIGVSGITIKPNVYVAVGISGQIQHMIGATESGTVIAVNRDKDAPIFSQCDIGIVGDASEVLKALCEGMSKQ